MSEGDRPWIGADPGGKNNFGIAILQSDGSAYTCGVSCADEAIDVVRQQVKDSTPAGVGVDAPLWWGSGAAGRRLVDQRLRDAYHLSGGQVQSVNSLRGAALAQGLMFVQRMRESYGDVCVTEAHPKALLVALESNEQNFYSRCSVLLDAGTVSEHERDAVISAVAAREGFRGHWTNDLSGCRYPSEQDPSLYWLAPVHYFWPEDDELSHS